MGNKSYDIIGDIHGQAEELKQLLELLGYVVNDKGIYTHNTRKIIFLGDFIDRGDYQKEVLSVVRPMVESGAALAVMGNHEYNAIAYATVSDNKDEYLRPHTDKNIKQHKAFLGVYEADKAAYSDVINWFKTLPLWLDLGDLRVIHACWDAALTERINKDYNGNLLTDDLLINSSKKGYWEYEAIETLLKGKEIPLKDGISFKDKDNNTRHNIRVRWWDQSATNYKSAFMGPESARTHIPDDDIEGDHLVEYSYDEPPVFLGHYWMEGEPEPLSKNIACLDYSVAKPGGKLVAYRWDGEKNLKKGNYVYVHRTQEIIINN